MADVCLICGVPHAVHRACAVCDTAGGADGVGKQPADESRMCLHCRTDPANLEWSQPDRLTATQEQLREHWAAGKKLRDTTRLTRAIIELATLGVVEVRYRRFDKNGRSLGWRSRFPAPTQRQIAEALHCSRAYVAKVLKKVRGGEI